MRVTPSLKVSLDVGLIEILSQQPPLLYFRILRGYSSNSHREGSVSERI
jgi:hypothetical protein